MPPKQLSRRRFLAAGAAAGAASIGPLREAVSAAPQPAAPTGSPGEKLRVATCQFPVEGDPASNAGHVREFMRRAAGEGAHLLHTSEAALSGYAGIDVPSFEKYDWGALRGRTAELRSLAAELGIWLVLGSAHYLDERTKPTNCLYLIDPKGAIADRYDKCMCTGGDQKYYSAGARLVTREIHGVTIGLAICYDICWPQIYMAYRERGAKVMIHSFHNARGEGENCLDTLNQREVATRCADNRMWAVANNSSQPYSHWGAFIARPDATIPKALERNRPGMLIHDFPDGVSPGGWYHNFQPMKLAAGEPMTWGKSTDHPRQLDGTAEP